MKESKLRNLLRFIIRLLVIWAVEVFGLILMAWILPGVRIDSLFTAIMAVAVIGVLNALLWPLLSHVILPFAVLSLGLVSLVLNGLMVQGATWLVDGFHVDTIWNAILLTIGLTAINTIVSSLLTIDDDVSWYRNVVRRRVKRRDGLETTDVPGVLFLEIDGLAEPVLERAIREGHLPTLARWLEEGSHRLVSWETDLSSQTSASQAGILHGDNDNIPAFRWYDRAEERLVASSNPTMVAELEHDRSDGHGLLAEGGASRGNLFSGDAVDVMYTASTITDFSRLRTGSFYAYFANPYNFSRTLLLFIWDVLLEIWQFRKARRQDIQPRLDRKKRGGKYPVLRASMTVLMRELNVYTLIGDMFAGVPSVYSTFVGYDEVAHHSGVESEDAFDVLRKMDQQLARLESAARQAPRPYHFVILSDHGQSGGATFKQRYHMTLEAFVQQLAAEGYEVRGDVDVHEDWSHLNVFLTDTIQHDRPSVSRPVRRALKRHTHEDKVVMGPQKEHLRGEDKTAEEDASSIVVLASGNLGLIYFTDWKERMTLEEIEAAFPAMIPGLAQHEGIGFLMVRSTDKGPMVIGAKGAYYLDAGQVEGENPLAPFGPNAAEHLCRTDGFPDAPDILVNSFYRAEGNEVAAFEEQIGCHGGMGGYQTRPFVLHPAEWESGGDQIVGAEAVYQVFKNWTGQLAKAKDQSETPTALRST